MEKYECMVCGVSNPSGCGRSDCPYGAKAIEEEQKAIDKFWSEYFETKRKVNSSE